MIAGHPRACFREKHSRERTRERKLRDRLTRLYYRPLWATRSAAPMLCSAELALRGWGEPNAHRTHAHLREETHLARRLERARRTFAWYSTREVG